MHDLCVYEVKTAVGRRANGRYTLQEVIPVDQVFRPLKDSAWPLVKMS